MLTEKRRIVNKNMKKITGEYFIGLDCGTNSTGWAVTDRNYEMLEFNGKAMWGVRLFDEAKTAAERRSFRSARRRREREKQRLEMLQNLFSNEIAKIDFSFFQRLNDSALYPEDKSINQHNTLFNDSSFTDKEYHKLYPTIYHLRKALMENDVCFDIRLIYLAVHHILKKRGHFLFESDFNKAPSLKTAFDTLNTNLSDMLDFTIPCTDEKLKEIEVILKSRNISGSRKSEKIREILEISKQMKQEKAIIDLFSGANAKLSDIFMDDALKESSKNGLKLSEVSFDEIAGELETLLGENFIVLDSIKAVYDWGILATLIGNEDNISSAKVKSYEKHRYDKMILKRVIKKYCPEKYKEVFLATNLASNYPAYVGHSIDSKGKKQVLSIKKITSTKDFCRYIKPLIETIQKDNPDDADVSYLITELENETLLPKQTTIDNSLIPKQLNEYELKIILEKASHYYQILNEIDETGLSTKEKIIKLFNYKIPYFIGPLNGVLNAKGESTSWAVRKTNEKITPWNFNKVIDVDASAEKFIIRMTNKCTYLKGKDVIPKNSLLYSKYRVLNELNNLVINGEKISVETKRMIFEKLFMTTKKVTQKRLKTFLISECGYETVDTIKGIDGDFKSSLSSYLDFKEYLVKGILSEDDVEKIILWIVLFGESKEIIRERILKFIPHATLSDNDFKYILSRNYKGWGRFSKEFLTLIGTDKRTGEMASIIENMMDNPDNPNINMLLSRNYDYNEKIAELNGDVKIERLDYSIVEELNVSPAVKHQIWQTLQIVAEIEKIIGYPPEKVFLEVAREKEKIKQRKDSRLSSLLSLYSAIKDDEIIKDYEVDKLKGKLTEETNERLRREKLYLYYTQLGRCAYTEHVIPLEKLFTSEYDIDHIYPQSLVKDDSILNNKVLVEKTQNALKSDNYPISSSIRSARHGFWNTLKTLGLISDEKYNRLTRNIEFSDEELAGFINRQLVETRQNSKAVAEILKNYFGVKTEIVYVKADIVSSFRDEMEIYKCRELNDLHHAKDAYLNIVCGNVYLTKFSRDPLIFIKQNRYKTMENKEDKDKFRSYNLKRMYDKDIIRADYTAWLTGENGTIQTVRKYMNRNDILFTRCVNDQKGGLFDQMPVKKGTNDGLIPLKGIEAFKATDKYGGYNKSAAAYFFIVQHSYKKKRIITVETVPLYKKAEIKNETDLLTYCVNELELINPRIIKKHVKYGSLMEKDGFKIFITGKTGDRLVIRCAVQLSANIELTNLFHHIIKYNRDAAPYQIQLNQLKKNHKPEDQEKIQRLEEDIATRLVPKSFKGNTEKILLSDENVLMAYDWLISKAETVPYKYRPNNQAAFLREARDNFIPLSLKDKCTIIEQILFQFGCSANTTSNLTLINGKANAGVLTLSKTLNSPFKLYNCSITGLFTNMI